MNALQIAPIGAVSHRDGEMLIRLEPKYAPALQGLSGFSHLKVLWWCDGFDTDEARQVLEAPKPYRNGPDVLGIFATRSPLRPNPIALTTAQILRVNEKSAEIQVAWIDADDGSPVLDLKPYTPSSDRVESPTVPGWCAHWPKSLESSEDFDWEKEFNF